MPADQSSRDLVSQSGLGMPKPEAKLENVNKIVMKALKI